MPTPSLQKMILFSLLSLMITHSFSQCLDHQKSLLLELKNELVFEPRFSQKLVQWNQTRDCCSWFGVECDGSGNVKGLQLDDEGISDGIGNSSSLFKLKYLEKLNLAYNEFNNVEIPRGIGSLTSLTHLNLSMAGFGGQVPLQLSFLTRLTSLDISRYDPIQFPIISPLIKLELPHLEMLVNNLPGLRELYLDGVEISSHKSEWSYIIPSYLPHLTSLSLSNCNLSGPLDKSLLQHHSLSYLRLDYNNLSSLVPNLLGNYSNFTTLRLNNCSLRGYFPETIFLIPTLQNLDLSDNELLSGTLPSFTQIGSLKSIKLRATNFSGLIPSSIDNLKTLSEFDLLSCKFTGPIPSTLANLTQLITLDFSFNFFTGSLPSTLFIGLSNLDTLELGYNSFTGNIPRSLFGLPSLRWISLNDNQLTGQVEFPIVNVSNIIYMDLSSNRLEGPIPDSFFQLQKLSFVVLSDNLFNGTFQLVKIQSLPNLSVLSLSNNFLSVNVSSSSISFPQLKRLGLASCNLSEFPDSLKHVDWVKLDLSNNRISGAVPSWIWGNGRNNRYLNLSSNLLTDFQKPYYIPPSLGTLDLHANQFRGELPSLSPKSDLWFLSVANNNFRRSIPTWLCNATNLKFLDLSVNKLSGLIPPCLFENMEYLEVLKLGQNNLSGGIPDNISQNCRLQIFDLNNNTLNGIIPKSLENCKSLELINVGNNIIHDSFPCMLSSRLRVLVLHSNRLHGEVRCQKSWPDIQIVDISSNNFSGNLEMVNFSSWRVMMLGSDPQLRPNGLLQPPNFYYPVGVRIIMKGVGQEIVKIWPDFTSVDFSSNNFQGEIPDAIGDLQSLYLLNLSHNSLTGTIPKSLGALTKLESLDLSGNQLTGAIPVDLAHLTFLSFLNLSFNKLVGKIPSGRQFQTFSAGSYKGNPGLCGFPLSRSCTRNEVNELSAPEDEDVQPKKEIEWEYISAALGYVVGLGIIVWILLFRRSFRERYFDKIDEVVEEICDGRNRRRRHTRRRLVNHQGRR